MAEILDSDDEKVLFLITSQIEELAKKASVSPLSLDDIKKMDMLHARKDIILGKRQAQQIDILDTRPARELTAEQLLAELDKVKKQGLMVEDGQ